MATSFTQKSSRETRLQTNDQASEASPVSFRPDRLPRTLLFHLIVLSAQLQQPLFIRLPSCASRPSNEPLPPQLAASCGPQPLSSPTFADICLCFSTPPSLPTTRILSSKGPCTRGPGRYRAIIVEDDPRWLPDPQGCDHIRALLMGPQRVVDRVLMLSLWSFPEKGLDLGHDTDGDEQVRHPFFFCSGGGV